jgi:hypothetical protein
MLNSLKASFFLFTYKISKSHLFFQVMQCGVETEIQFHYNATLDAFASPPTGMTYHQFLSRNKDRISNSNNHNNLVMVPVSQSPAGLQQSQQSTQAAAQQVAASDPSLALSHQSSVSQAASLTTSAANATSDAFDAYIDTPRRRLRFPPLPVGQDLLSEIEDPDSNSRPPLTGVAAHLESLRNKQTRDNQRIIKELAQAKGVNLSIDSDMIEDLFTSKQWNIQKYGLLSLALHGVIAVVDKRLTLSPEHSVDETEVQTNDIIGSDLSKENDTAKEKQ